ncbi:RagB/SusD family nutrient uptake outer membrane protein [Empedobacter sedimenti]|uniref:RagB/SusD family nutrient uptake outer membrane protein n=1 Tax=Empedobacter sedimenti TaxID=3042610 RepID=UPI0024A69DA2|nr:RagB/SusD family nutrient uptake outer membrane protein [Empedobacter sedimenti]
MNTITKNKFIKNHSSNKTTYFFKVLALAMLTTFASCEENLDEIPKDKFAETNFFTKPEHALLALNSTYRYLSPDGSTVWGAAYTGIVAQSSATTDEMVVSWGDAVWPNLAQLNFSESFPSEALYVFYRALMPAVTTCTINIGKIEAMTNLSDADKKSYIAQLKALRAHYTWILYNHYGGVPIRVDYKEAININAAPIPRLTNEQTFAQIEKDYKEAIADLPTLAAQAGSDYGRFTKDAAYMGLVKLYMHDKKWNDVITTSRIIMGMGHSLQTNYTDLFSFANKGNKQEILFALSTKFNSTPTNIWLAHALPGNYVGNYYDKDENRNTLTQWGGYKMPWSTYDKFDKTDKRTARLLAKWLIEDPNDKSPKPKLIEFDARANKYIGAIPMKFNVDPTGTGYGQGTDVVIWRYADVLLSLAEAINETSGPTAEAYDLIGQVRKRAGLANIPAGLSKDQFRDKLMDERLFEFWNEGGIRREDLIRWGKYIQFAKDRGSAFAKNEFVLLPIPRAAIDASGGVIKQNPGY